MNRRTSKEIAELARLLLTKAGITKPHAYKRLKRDLRKQWYAAPRKSAKSVRHAPIVGRYEIRGKMERKIVQLREEVRAMYAAKGQPA